MGLDISTRGHSFRAGSYSGFNDFRNWLAQKIGYTNYTDLLMQTNEKAGEWLNKRQQSKYASTACKAGALFHHSDCEGFISAKDAKILYKDLVDIKNQLPQLTQSPDTNEFDEETWYRERLDDWIKAAKDASENEDSIWFY